MTTEYTRNNTVTFTDDEMNAFDRDSIKDFSDSELEGRKGELIHTADVLDDVIDDPDLHPIFNGEYRVNYHVYADKMNPTMVVVEDENNSQIFRLVRPTDLSEISDTIMTRNIEIKQEQEYQRNMELFEREQDARENDN